MKIAVISDIHGNYPALEAVLNDIKKEGADHVYCLGDLTGYYCMFNEVIETVRGLKIRTIMGNHDYALLYKKGIIERSKTCTRILARQLEEITKENFQFLETCERNITFNAGSRSFYCVHAGLVDPIDEYIGEVNEEYFEKNAFQNDVLISGHTHVPRNEMAGRWQYLNPGSVGQPRDKNPHASYLLVTEHTAKNKRVAYDIDKIVLEMKKNNYEPYIYEILYRGTKIGG